MKCLLKFLFLIIFLNVTTNAQTSSLVYFGEDGKLVYKADSLGNIVPDFSDVGYMNSEESIPTVPVVKTVEPVEGDNLANVQSAIDEVAAMPLDANGFRGAILFKAGVYNISDVVRVSASGIVIRGEGANFTTGTRFVATKEAQHSLILFSGSSGKSAIESSAKKIVDTYVPVGAKKVTVNAGHNFSVGEWVLLRRVPKQSWIDLLNMAQYGWTASGYVYNYERKITAIQDSVIFLDAPVVDIIDQTYSDGYLVKYTSGRIEKCGIEDIRLQSTWKSPSDEQHGWNAVEFHNVINSWARNMDAYYFGYSAVNMTDNSRNITVDNCRMMDPISETTGGRKYSFNLDGQRCLVQNCYTRGGRHDYVNGSRTSGPNVFYKSQATGQNADIGPHHRWSTGILYDNIVGNGEINVQNRGTSGSGHGWVGAQIMLWNCTASKIILQDPQGDYTNWAIGCKANITNAGSFTEPIGFVESKGTNVLPASLFVAQLEERLATITSVKEVDGVVPSDFNLHQNYPNPFNPSTTISLSIPKSGNYSLSVYNVLGQLVTTLIDKELTQGNYEVIFDGKNLTSGMYIYRLTGENINISKKMILMK